MNKKSFASTIIAVIFVCPVLAVTHTFTPTDIGSLKIKMSDGSLQPGDTLLLQDEPIPILVRLVLQKWNSRLSNYTESSEYRKGYHIRNNRNTYSRQLSTIRGTLLS